MTDLRGLVDLAAERVGGRALVANDEFFAPKENLLRPGRGEFIEGKYTDRGKWMDGWETRRRRQPGFDWCVVRLGIPGVVRAVTVDTNHFRGNYPESCSLDAAALTGDPDAAAAEHRGAPWFELLPKTQLAGHTEHVFPAVAERRLTHVRLNIYPDGGVARLRVWGEARPDWDAIAKRGAMVDLAAAELGGAPLGSSDEFFSHPTNLVMPDRPANMGDGWETRRRRGPGYDWVILRLGHRGALAEVEIDTTNFKGNYPDTASLEGCDASGLDARALPGPEAAWRELLPRAKLGPDERHRFKLAAGAPVTHVRLNIFPDGGVARLRVLGTVV